MKFKLDDVDHKILDLLIDNSRIPFTDIAKKLLISAGTVHVRVKKMEEFGIIQGASLALDYKKLGYTFIAYIGIFLWWSGFLIEVIADYQKRKFRETSDPKSEFISSGLWARSRHPNYFGEITLWIGMAVLSLSSLSGIEYVTAIVSPVFVYLLLRKAEGVPMLERIAEERYGDLPEYQQYKENTPVLMMKLFK